MVSEIIESEEDEVEVEFYPDTELNKLSDEEKEELRLLKEEDNEKETLHSKRNKDIIKEDDDE